MEAPSRIRACIEEARSQLHEELKESTNGVAACQKLSDVYDRLISELFASAVASTPRRRTGVSDTRSDRRVGTPGFVSLFRY